MPDPPQSLRLEVRFDDGSPTGHATATDGNSRRFAGWLALMAAIEALAPDEASPPTTRPSHTQPEERP